MSATDPYIPPISGDASGDEGFLWHTQGNTLFVRNGTVLPPIDLATAEEGSDLIRVKKESTKDHWASSLIFPLAPSILCYFLIIKWHLDFDNFILLAAFPVFGLINYLLSKCISKKIQYHIYQNRKTHRADKKNPLKLILLIGSLFLMLAPVLMTSHFTQGWRPIVLLMIPGLMAAIASSIWIDIGRPRLRESAGPDGWVSLTGLDPLALHKLKIIEHARYCAQPDISVPVS